MTRPFYSEYVRHCMRFYSRNTAKPQFKTEVDKNNWYACHRAMERFADVDREMLTKVYALYDTIADNVYEVAQAYGIDQNLIWNLIKELERSVAKKRGLI